jgi:transcriptional regulator with XRE-family HTH domain
MLNVRKIEALREKKGMTMEIAAKKAGLTSKQQWWNIVGDGRTNIKLNTLYGIAKALGCKAKDLLE